MKDYLKRRNEIQCKLDKLLKEHNEWYKEYNKVCTEMQNLELRLVDWVKAEAEKSEYFKGKGWHFYPGLDHSIALSLPVEYSRMLEDRLILTDEQKDKEHLTEEDLITEEMKKRRASESKRKQERYEEYLRLKEEFGD